MKRLRRLPLDCRFETCHLRNVATTCSVLLSVGLLSVSQFAEVARNFPVGPIEKNIVSGQYSAVPRFAGVTQKRTSTDVCEHYSHLWRSTIDRVRRTETSIFARFRTSSPPYQYLIMPTCMASSVYSSCLIPTCWTQDSPHSIWAKCSRDGIRTGLTDVTGLQGFGTFFQLKSVGKSCPVRQYVKRKGLVSVRAEGPESTTTTTTSVAERSEADAIVDGMSFGELCDEFECISSPAVEATARQLVRDILELREGSRGLATYAIFVTYKDPLRSFKGREKYKRPSWVRATLDNPTAAVQEMVMLSTSTLNIKWTLRGKPKLPPASIIGGNLVVSINSTFTLNQISGQVTAQVVEWDLSKSSAPALAYFWATRLSYSAIESGKDAMDAVAGVSKILDKGKDDDRATYYRDPSGDPRKFFQVDDNPMKDIYQVALVIALIYLLVQFLKLTL